MGFGGRGASSSFAGGGGGGGGYFGGGGGGSDADSCCFNAGGGGGGSSFAKAGSTLLIQHYSGVRVGNGLAVITYRWDPQTPTPTPTPSPTPDVASLASPSAEPTPEPSTNPSPEPVATPTPSPEASQSSEPLPPAASAPDPTSTPTSTPASTPVPTSSAEPVPVQLVQHLPPTSEVVLEQHSEADSVGSQTPISDDLPETATAVTAQMTAEKIDQLAPQKTPQLEVSEVRHSADNITENTNLTQPVFSAKQGESQGLKALEGLGGWPIQAASVFLVALALLPVIKRRRTTTEPRLVRLN